VWHSVNDDRRALGGAKPLKIISRLQGGLGNQLFQFAVARAMGVRLGASVVLDNSSLVTDKKRRYELGAFKFPSTVPIISRPDGNRRGLLSKWLDPVQAVREKHFEFDPEIVALRPGVSVHLIGYWQTEKYFRDVSKQIRDDLQFVSSPDEKNAALLEQIQSCNAVSVHFRRGDYVSETHTAAYHGTPSMDYYRRAVSMIMARVPDAHLFVFSDEPQWVKDHFKPDAPLRVVDTNCADAPAADLRLMAACRHHILANSSFSWWGAWLNPRADKMVVAPKRWFHEAKSNTIDLLPDGWLTIDAD